MEPSCRLGVTIAHHRAGAYLHAVVQRITPKLSGLNNIYYLTVSGQEFGHSLSGSSAFESLKSSQLSESSTGQDLFSRSLTWWLAGFSYSWLVELRS